MKIKYTIKPLKYIVGDTVLVTSRFENIPPFLATIKEFDSTTKGLNMLSTKSGKFSVSRIIRLATPEEIKNSTIKKL